ncbi:hypothetical protein MRY87_05050 [bacterium]|nr:hypothetical protein [bacterium]
MSTFLTRLFSDRTTFFRGGILLLVFFCAHPCSGENFEKDPVRRASEVLSPQIRQGKLHAVEEIVKSNGYQEIYSLKTPFGQQTVRGRHFLEKRIAETYAAAQLQEAYPSSSVASEAVVDTATGIVTAPVKAAEKAYDTVTDTEKMKETARAVPGGIAHLFQVATQAIGAGASFAYESGSALAQGETGSARDRVKEAGTFLEKAALDYIGYNDAYRTIAQTLEVDPYTENETLRGEVRRVARIQTGVRMAGKFTPGIPGIPYVSEFNRYEGYASQLALYDDPAEVDKLSLKIFEALGRDSENSKKTEISIKKLFANPAYTPATRRMLSSQLKALRGADRVDELVTIAAGAKDREGAHFFLSSITYLATKRNGEISSFLRGTKIPIAVTKKNSLLLPLQVDFLVWTQSVARFFQTLREKVMLQGKFHGGEVVLTGTLTPRCRQELRALGIQGIAENTPF